MGYSREIYDEAMAMVNANRTKAIEECAGTRFSTGGSVI